VSVQRVLLGPPVWDSRRLPLSQRQAAIARIAVLLLFAIVFVAAVAVALLTNNDEGAGSETMDTPGHRPGKGGVTPTPALQNFTVGREPRAASDEPKEPVARSSPLFSGLWTVTAYCPCRKCCGPRARGVTASGTRADHRLVAGPPEIPFGAIVSVPGYGLVRCEDRGGAIRGRRLDVLMPDHAEALAWGVRHVQCVVARGS